MEGLGVGLHYWIGMFGKSGSLPHREAALWRGWSQGARLGSVAEIIGIFMSSQAWLQWILRR